VVVDRRRERHEQRCCADGRDFCDGAGTGARDDDVGVRIGLRRVFDEGRELALDAGGRVVGAQFVDLPGAALVQHLRARLARDARERLRHHGVEAARAEAAADHQQLQRTGAARETHGRLGLRSERRAQRVAHPLRLLQHVREGREHAVGHACQHLVGEARHRVLLVQHQRLAHEHAHHSAREGDVAAQAHQHVGLHAAHHAQALPEGAQQLQRQQEQRERALAAHAAELHRLEGEAARRHQLFFHAAGRAQPVHLPAALAQGLGHRESGEDVAARAAGHDECGAPGHTRPPRISTRFS
jgi:hypothetical protein